MDLKEFLYQKRMQIKEFAGIIKYDRSSITEVIHGRRTPGRKLIEAIEEATGGLVTRDDLLKKNKDYLESNANE